MPNPSEIAVVVAGGSVYNYWQTVEVDREFGKTLDFARVTVAEIGDITHGWKTLRLQPGNPAQVYLAGIKVIDGKVTIRQVSFDPEQHGVEITIASSVLSLTMGTVDANPGQYIGYTFPQIATSICAAVGVKFQVIGSPSDIDMPFARVSEHPGETRYDFIERLGRMRNVHLSSDGMGTLLASRGIGSASIADLVEGKNIESARLVWRNDITASKTTTIGSLQGGSSSGQQGDGTRDLRATAQNPDYHGPETLTVLTPQADNVKGLAHHSDHENNFNVLTQVDLEVVTYGWFMPNGSLWIQHVGEPVTVFSPMCFPTDSMTLRIKGVTHRQNSDGGTTTMLRLCLPYGLGGGDQVQTSGDLPSGMSIPDPAQPG